VAAAVGCSVSSVSPAVSGKAEGRIRQETQDAIHAAIARLGYRLNTTAAPTTTAARCGGRWPGTFAGLVLASPGGRLLDGFVPTCPTVLLDAGGPVAGPAGVDVDLREALAEPAAHLTGLGHRRRRTSASAARRPRSRDGGTSRPRPSSSAAPSSTPPRSG
jgi:DNA-binding LacI/PurR family transcriptional regulator